MRTAILFSVVTSVFASSVFAADLSEGFSRSSATPAIQGGTRTAEWPSSGAIFMSSYGSQIDGACSGTLIAPRWVLTAAHCIIGESQFAFVVGSDVSSISNSQTMPPINVASVYYDHQFNINQLGGGHDIGLLHLTEDLALLPFKLNTVAFDDSVIGLPFTAIGYGVTSPNGNTFGVKYSVDLTIASYDAAEFQEGGSNMGTCEGDSGGPEFVLDGDGFPLMIGATSNGTSNSCAGSYAQRIDTEITYIESVVGTGVICRNGESCDGIFRDGFE